MQPTYDAVGNVIESVTTLPQGVDTQVFCYDDLSRLVWAGSSGTPTCANAPTPSDTGSLSGTGAQYSASYAYDAMNRLTVSSLLGAYTYGDSAHADAATSIHIPGWTAAYDAAGNMTCEATSSATTCAGTPTGAQLSYDNEGQLAAWQNTPTSPTSTDSFLYDGEGQRVEQVSTASGTTTSTTYIGGLEDITTTGGSTTTTAYYDGLALSINGVLTYTLSDALGSVGADVNSAGGVVGIQLYDPYGSARYSSGTMLGSYGYTGQQTDTTTGLNYDHARYYAPGTGQFTSGDTTYAGGANLYGYVGGNPTTFTDPSGHHANSCVTPGCEGGAGGAGEGGTGGGTGVLDPPATVAATTAAAAYTAVEVALGGTSGALGWIVAGGVLAVVDGTIGAVLSEGIIHYYETHPGTTVSSTSSMAAIGPTMIGTAYATEYGGISALWPSPPSNTTPPPGPPTPPGPGIQSLGSGETTPEPQADSAGATSGGGDPPCGGSYGALKGKVPGTEVHHMPPDSVNKLPKDQGPAIRMSAADHRMMMSTAGGADRAAYRANLGGLIDDGHWELAQQSEIENVRFWFGNKYDGCIDQMLKYSNSL